MYTVLSISNIYLELFILLPSESWNRKRFKIPQIGKGSRSQVFFKVCSRPHSSFHCWTLDWTLSNLKGKGRWELSFLIGSLGIFLFLCILMLGKHCLKNWILLIFLQGLSERYIQIQREGHEGEVFHLWILYNVIVLNISIYSVLFLSFL